jgi:hypothetical protein
MPKERTTGCKQEHRDKNCPDCRRVRVRRSRALKRKNPTPRLPLSAAQRQANAAACYVRKYLKRGAIAPPDACDRCAVPVQMSPSRPLSRLHFFHPDPAQPRLVAWLCTNCRRYVRATRESLTLTWTWPGITAPRSRKPPNLRRQVAATVAALDAKFPPATAPGLRDAALIATLVRALAPGERERLYAAGSLAGPGWQPTSDPHLNALLRGWAFIERADRGAAARAAGGVSITPLPPEPRRVRDVLPPPPPAPPRPPVDPLVALAKIQAALEQLNAAEAAAIETNARVERAVRERFG